MHSEDECTKFYPEYKDESCIDVGFTEYCAWDYGGHFFLQPEDYARICADDKVLFGCHSIASGLKPPDYKILYELCYDEAKTISKKRQLYCNNVGDYENGTCHENGYSKFKCRDKFDFTFYVKEKWMCDMSSYTY